MAATPPLIHLKSLAGEMASGKPDVPVSRRTRFPQGLELACERRNGRWSLSVAREDPAAPSDNEVDAVLDAFRVPAGAECSRNRKRHPHPKSGRQILYNVVEVHWTEVEQSRV